MINNIKNNTISEADARTKLNALNEIKKTEIKGKRLINGPKKLLHLFDDLLEAIFNNKNNVSVNVDNNVSVNEDNNVSVNEDNNVSVNENDDVSVNENNNVSANESKNDNESERESESENQNGDDQYYVIKQLNNYFRTIYETKSFEEQIIST